MDRDWVATWESAPAGVASVSQVERIRKVSDLDVPAPQLLKGTFRYRLRISKGGTAIRLTLSNRFGADPLRIEGASVGRVADGLNAAPGSIHDVTFGGQVGALIAPGAEVLSDPVEMSVPDGADLLVSVFNPDGHCVATKLPGTDRVPQVGFSEGNALGEARPAQMPISERPMPSEVDVLTTGSRRLVVTLGDSITDGTLGPDYVKGWSGTLARRLSSLGIAEVNAGIGANRLLLPVPMPASEQTQSAALARLDRDVLMMPGITHIVLLEGINDIGMGANQDRPDFVAFWGNLPLVRPSDLTDGYRQIIAKAHARGVKVIGGTIMPFKGSMYYSAAKDEIRQAVNRWIRTSNAFDGVIDFDAFARDRADPLKLRSDIDLGDHLHPSTAGERLIGNMIDVRLFQ
jgi:lysophospholipase L1-like esterase